jgi:hypothetical protein
MRMHFSIPMRTLRDQQSGPRPATSASAKIDMPDPDAARLCAPLNASCCLSTRRRAEPGSGVPAHRSHGSHMTFPKAHFNTYPLSDTMLGPGRCAACCSQRLPIADRCDPASEEADSSVARAAHSRHRVGSHPGSTLRPSISCRTNIARYWLLVPSDSSASFVGCFGHRLSFWKPIARKLNTTAA